MSDTSDQMDESEHLSPRSGNFKEIHHHTGNGSMRIVWAWAGFATAAVVILVSWYASEQSQTNARVTDALTGLSVKAGQIEGKLDGIQRTVDRLERRVDDAK